MNTDDLKKHLKLIESAQPPAPIEELEECVMCSACESGDCLTHLLEDRLASVSETIQALFLSDGWQQEHTPTKYADYRFKTFVKGSEKIQFNLEDWHWVYVHAGTKDSRFDGNGLDELKYFLEFH